MKSLSVIVVLALFVFCISAIPQGSKDTIRKIPCKYALYKQCDARWAKQRLGTSPTATICSAGCAMSSVSMALYSHGIQINGTGPANPETLNKWLNGHQGYFHEDEIMWNSIHVLGKMYLTEFTKSLTKEYIKDNLSRCNPVIANVRGGTHWVLLTGWEDSNDNVFYVNDPGFEQESYEYSGMVWFVSYAFH